MQWNFNFEIKFYPPDPQLLHEDLTRYQLCLQIRKDIVTGKLPCSVVTYSLLGSFTVQSELGDFDVEEFGPGVEYIRKMKFAPAQDRELLKKIADLHKTHKGQTPEEAELNFLEHAKKLAMYGVEIFDAKDGEGIDIQLGICASGILVFREKLQINKFVWPKILKMSYRRTKFYIKLRTAEFDDFQTLVGFKFLSSKHAKRMWKFCVENHSFFRNREPDSPGTRRTVLRFGSRFRYSGRTQFQARQAMQTVDRPSPYFDRNYSQHGKRATYHGKTKHQRIEDEMFKPRPPPITRDPPMFDQNDVDRKPIPEPEIRDEEDVFEHEEEPENRKSRMEKIHGIRTPLAAVMKSDHAENNNVEQTPPRARDYDDEEDDSFNKPPLEESMVRTRHSYPDGLARGGKREKHDIDSIGANTNTNKSNIINQHGEKRQHGRRGRSRSQSQGKKVYFDEESLQSASSHISRSDSELGPHKRKTSIERQFQKKSERRRPTKQVTIEYRGTPNYHGPLSSNVETERRMYEIGDGSLHNRSEISVDEGFADLDESFSSSKDKKSMKMILRYEQPAYSKVRNSENVWLSGDYFGNQKNTRIPELDLSPITHKSDSDLTHSTNTSNTTHVTDAPPMLRSLSHEPQHISVKSRSKVHRDQDPVMSREQKNRLYGYSSSDSSDNEMEQSFSRSFVRNSHLAGRRGRRNLSTNSRSSLEKSQEEGSLLRRNKERRDSLRNEEESEERDVFKDTEMKKGENDQRNIVQTKSEAILLEKYIIHRPSQTSSMSQEDDQYLDMMSPLSVNQTPGEMVTDHIKGTDKENELDALLLMLV
ncbi:hypothetical protein FSP39_009080 [Pinctada imbricata]|uniref:FERM domain-containing protein n=1 Tax=Pinctada imbricata TaxID=66713 RepID=A0AA88Y3Y8_PINIB|nr:hypothetical protein FSP39_009080 [Pinctada imbricata]